LIAQKPVIGLERAQYIEAAGKCNDEAAIGRRFLGWTFHSLLWISVSLTTDVLQNNPSCQDAEFNFAVRN
jgi:hypothetical protein